MSFARPPPWQPSRTLLTVSVELMAFAAIMCYYGYVLLGLLAVSRYHHPAWSLPAAALGVAYMTLSCIVDTRCVLLFVGTSLPTPISPVFNFNTDRFCYTLLTYGNILVGDLGQTTVTIAWFNGVTWSLTFVSCVRLLLLALEGGLCPAGKTLRKQGSALDQLFSCCRGRHEDWSRLPGLTPLSPSQSGALAAIARALRAAPLRHNVACLLTSLTLITMCMYTSTLTRELSVAISALDPGQPGVPRWLAMLAVYAQGFCEWALVSVWIVAAILGLLMVASYGLIWEDELAIFEAYAPKAVSSPPSASTPQPRSAATSREHSTPVGPAEPLLGTDIPEELPVLVLESVPHPMPGASTGRAKGESAPRPVFEASSKWTANLTSADVPRAVFARHKGLHLRNGALDLDSFDFVSGEPSSAWVFS